MVFWLCAACVLLVCICVCLLVKIYMLHKAAEEIRTGFAERLREDTNLQIDLSSRDAYMRELAADINQQLKLFRQEQIRYLLGDQELRRAVTNLAHDLRTPLTAICGYLDLLCREEMTDRVRRYLQVVENRVDALKEMAEELFRYSVLTSVEEYEEQENVSLNRAIEECLAGYYGALKAAGIEPAVHVPGQTIYKNLNKKALDRILQNIVSNVIKYSDGDFIITLSENGTLRFQNHARGLDAVQAAHLFDRFYTVENGRKSTGLGLAIAKKLSEEMGGGISAEYFDGILSITVFWYT